MNYITANNKGLPWVNIPWKDQLVSTEDLSMEEIALDPRLSLVLLVADTLEWSDDGLRLSIPADNNLYEHAKTQWTTLPSPEERNLLATTVNRFLRMIEKEEWGLLDMID